MRLSGIHAWDVFCNLAPGKSVGTIHFDEDLVRKFPSSTLLKPFNCYFRRAGRGLQNEMNDPNFNTFEEARAFFESEWQVRDAEFRLGDARTPEQVPMQELKAIWDSVKFSGAMISLQKRKP